MCFKFIRAALLRTKRCHLACQRLCCKHKQHAPESMKENWKVKSSAHSKPGRIRKQLESCGGCFLICPELWPLSRWTHCLFGYCSCETTLDHVNVTPQPETLALLPHYNGIYIACSTFPPFQLNSSALVRCSHQKAAW